jgi:hypothetical protein
LNHSSGRLQALLQSKGAELPPPIAALLPPLLAPRTPLLGLGGSGGGGDAMESQPEEWWRDAFPSEAAARLAGGVRDRLRAQLEAATRRRLMAAEQGLAGPLGGPPPADASLLAALVESGGAEPAAQGESGQQPPHWRLHALAHGLLAAGAAAELDLTLALGNTLALADAHAPLLKRLLAVRTAALPLATAAAMELGDGDGNNEGGGKGAGEAAAATEAAAEAAPPEPEAALLEAEAGPGACGVLLDAISYVWADCAPSLAAALVLALATRGLVPPDKALAWMGDPTPGSSTGGRARAGALSLSQCSVSHAPLELATDLLLAACDL